MEVFGKGWACLDESECSQSCSFNGQKGDWGEEDIKYANKDKKEISLGVRTMGSQKHEKANPDKSCRQTLTQAHQKFSIEFGQIRLIDY